MNAVDLTRRAPFAAFAPSSFDAESRTVEAIISTGTGVTRKDQLGTYIERLDLNAINPDALTGLAVLNEHKRGDALDRIGTVLSAKRTAEGLVATLQLSGASDVAPIIARIADGTLTAVSIGYNVSKWAENRENGQRVRTAKNWQLIEVSVVSIPADPSAKIRNQNMPETIDANATLDVSVVVQTRAEIRSIARAAGLKPEWADEMIDSGADETSARAAAFEAMQTRTQSPQIRVVSPSNDDPAIIRSRREEALFCRVAGGKPSDQARPFMNETLRDMARACVEASGVSTRSMDVDTLFSRAMHTTSDFSTLLTGVGNRTLMPAYQAAQSPLKTLARQATLTDFRVGSRLKLSDVGLLEKVSESGEIKSTTRGEATESYALETYATKFGISRKALINDDLGAFRDWGATAGRMAAETEANLLISLFRKSVGAGPVMGEDNKTLFHADHGNLAATGSTIGLILEPLSDARLAMRNMKALDGKTPINATPKYLLVGPQSETAAEQVLAEIYATTFTDANPFAGRLTLLVEPRIDDLSWYLFADPAILPVLEYAYLSSAQGPQMASREGWDVLGMEFRVILDFGAGAVDWRGAYRNAGA